MSFYGRAGRTTQRGHRSTRHAVSESKSACRPSAGTFSPRRVNPLHVLWCALLVFVAMLLVGTPAQAGDDFLDPEDAFVFSAAMATPDRLDVHFQVAPQYYMYRDRFAFALEPDAAVLREPVFPPALVQYDPTFDEDMEVYYDQYTLQLPLNTGASGPLTLTVTSQGCADAGLCYPPMDHVVTLTPVSGGYTASGQGVVASVPDISLSTPPESYAVALSDANASDAGAFATSTAFAGPSGAAMQGLGLGQAMSLGDMALADWLKQAHLLEIVVLAAALGVLLTFTPCVLPMVPILLAVLAGDTKGSSGITRWRGFSLAAMFVLGMSVVYTALGVAAGLVGASLAVWLQTPWVLSLFALALAVLALAMFDVFTVQMPSGVQSSLIGLMNRLHCGRNGGVSLMGLVQT